MHSSQLCPKERISEGSTSNSDMVPNFDIKSLPCVVKVSNIDNCTYIEVFLH